MQTAVICTSASPLRRSSERSETLSMKIRVIRLTLERSTYRRRRQQVRRHQQKDIRSTMSNRINGQMIPSPHTGLRPGCTACSAIPSICSTCTILLTRNVILSDPLAPIGDRRLSTSASCPNDARRDEMKHRILINTGRATYLCCIQNIRVEQSLQRSRKGTRGFTIFTTICWRSMGWRRIPILIMVRWIID